MSFAGHVFDMIRRDKENRESRKILREKWKDRKENSLSASVPDISVEELEEINKQLKQKERKDIRARYYVWIVVILVGILLLIGLFIYTRL